MREYDGIVDVKSLLAWRDTIESMAEKVKSKILGLATSMNGHVYKTNNFERVKVSLDEIYARLKLEVIYLLSKECSDWHKDGRYIYGGEEENGNFR